MCFCCCGGGGGGCGRFVVVAGEGDAVVAKEEKGEVGDGGQAVEWAMVDSLAFFFAAGAAVVEVLEKFEIDVEGYEVLV